MKERTKNAFKGQLFTSLIYFVLGLCLVVFPEESVNIICKIIFGIVLMLAGLYHIWIYMSEDGSSTIFNLFTGAILLVLGVFFFQNPQIVKMILPSLMAALLLVDSIWTLKTGLRLKKYERNEWQFFVIVSLVFVTLGIILFINPFTDMKYTVLFAGWSFIGDAVLDFVSIVLAFCGNRAIEKGEKSAKKSENNELVVDNKKERKSFFSKIKRKDSEIIVSEDSDMKAKSLNVADEKMMSNVMVEELVSGNEIQTVSVKDEKNDTVKKNFGELFIEKFRKSKKKENENSGNKSVSEQMDGVKENTDELNDTQGIFELNEESDKVQEIFELKEESDKVQEIFELKEEPDKVQEIFELKEEPDKVQEIFELKEEPDRIQEMFESNEEKDHLKNLLKLDKSVLEE